MMDTKDTVTLYSAIVGTSTRRHLVLSFSPFQTLKALSHYQQDSARTGQPRVFTFFTQDGHGILSVDALDVESVEFTGQTSEHDLASHPVIAEYFAEGKAAVMERVYREGLQRLLNAIRSEDFTDESDDEESESDEKVNPIADSNVVEVPKPKYPFARTDTDGTLRLYVTQSRLNELKEITNADSPAAILSTPEYQAYANDSAFPIGWEEALERALVRDENTTVTTTTDFAAAESRVASSYGVGY